MTSSGGPSCLSPVPGTEPVPRLRGERVWWGDMGTLILQTRRYRHRTDAWDRRETQRGYLSQSEGVERASGPCRTRGCPRHDPQGPRSLWAERTELLRPSRGMGWGGLGRME